VIQRQTSFLRFSATSKTIVAAQKTVPHDDQESKVVNVKPFANELEVLLGFKINAAALEGGLSIIAGSQIYARPRMQ